MGAGGVLVHHPVTIDRPIENLFRNVVFDLDGLIVDTEPLYLRAYNLALQACRVSYQFTPEEYGRVCTGRHVWENAEYARQRFGLPQSVEALVAANRALYALLISDASNLELLPGVNELLSALASRRVRTAVATSADPRHLEIILRGLKLAHVFDAHVAKTDEMQPKPAPDVYLRALEALRARPEETVALEDSASGVRSAKAAGLYVIAVPNSYTRQQDFSMADRIARDLFEVKLFLAP